MSKLNGKIAVVTGATGGIGFQVAKRLGEDGCTVILNGIEDSKGQERVAELNAAGITAEYYGFDVTDENAVNENINKIGQKHGKIDILVNNAGGLGGRSRFEEMTTEFFRFIGRITEGGSYTPAFVAITASVILAVFAVFFLIPKVKLVVASKNNN